MKHIKLYHLALLGFLCLIDSDLARAVGGISNSKVVVPSADTVEGGRFEFEPFFGLGFLDDSDDTSEFIAGARFTLGALDTLEIGANVGFLVISDTDSGGREEDFGDIETGVKFRFIEQSESTPFSLAYQGGFSIPTSGEGAPWVFEPAGLILTKNFDEKLSMDADVVLFLVEDDSAGFVAELGFGYFITPRFQPVIEAGFVYENPDSGQSASVLNLTAGFTAPVSERLTVILGVTQDIYTNNADDATELTAAFTFLF
ncbi:MAG: hypothetical protein ACT4NX_01415 [Deltaproteobacteria bacterium]